MLKINKAAEISGKGGVMAEVFVRTGLSPENSRRRAIERKIRRITAEQDAQNDEFTGKLVGTFLICAVLDVAAAIFFRGQIAEIRFFAPLIVGNIAMFFWRFSEKKEGEEEKGAEVITFALRLTVSVVIAGIATAIFGGIIGIFVTEPIATIGGIFSGQKGWNVVHLCYYVGCGGMFVVGTIILFIGQMGPSKPPR